MSQKNEIFTRPIPIDKEVSWDKTQTIMSKTDSKGIMEYANEVFIDVSGYEDYELMSQPHSMVRHPDMPRVIFKVLWENLKAGKNFYAVVKNLAKSGRYYWVVTDFEISKNSNGEITHYFGRRKAVPQEVISKHIEPLYKRLLQIELASSMEASERYLIGFLEEKKRTYVEFVEECILDYEKTQNSLKREELEADENTGNRGFFSRLFGR